MCRENMDKLIRYNVSCQLVHSVGQKSIGLKFLIPELEVM